MNLLVPAIRWLPICRSGSLSTPLPGLSSLAKGAWAPLTILWSRS